MRKNATKVCKIRALAKVESVMKDLTPEEATTLEAKLTEMDSKKKKNNTDADEEVDEGDYAA